MSLLQGDTRPLARQHEEGEGAPPVMRAGTLWPPVEGRPVPVAGPVQHSTGATPWTMSSVSVTVVPCPTALSTAIRPPCCSTIVFTPASPMPMPPVPRAVEARKNGVKIRGASCTRSRYFYPVVYA